MHASDGVVPEWTLADRLRKARLLTGLEGQELADEIGIHRNSVRQVREGSGRAATDRAARLWALRTGVSYEWLDDGEGVNLLNRR